jgi:hypothetical protein
MSFMLNESSVVQVIESYKKSDAVQKIRSEVKAEQDAQWNALFDQVMQGYHSGEIKASADLGRALRPGEDSFMEKFYGDDPEAKWDKSTPKHKQGEWKYSLLPNGYTSAKSILNRAVDQGILLQYAGKGKSALSKAVADPNKTLEKMFRDVSRLKPYVDPVNWTIFVDEVAKL